MWGLNFLKSLFGKTKEKTKEKEKEKEIITTDLPKPAKPAPIEEPREDHQIDGELKRQFWAIGGGKGGVGKSLISVMLGASLTRWGKKVILVDADLGGGNLNLLTGINHPPHTLVDFMRGDIDNIEDIALDTPVKNLKVICGADDILGIANPGSAQKTRLLNNLKKLEADIIMLDLGAGTSYTTLDFFLFSPHKIIVMSPQTTAIQNAYGFIKTCLFRKLTREFRGDGDSMELINRCINAGDEEKIATVEELKDKFTALGKEQMDKLSACIKDIEIGLVINMVKDNKDIMLGRSLLNVTNEYLSIRPEYLGFIEHDKRLLRSINKMSNFLKDGTEIMTDMGFYDLANKVVKRIYKKSKGL